ncbi:hypothetical protein BSK52_20335 [Paenibacillus odorifer]|uniref:Glycosyltransferase 2-like domain-containing protein n=2 Tax=Paenibacillus odorifer TaxID=189426 RepID=A0A1R0XS29_9BACL|nr:hypothetical protein BSK52_20335 [Paenibacillus odorifer]
MMGIIEISVVIPVYNLENYIGRCLNSVLSQSLKEIEVIVINDGSTDDSEKIIKKYAECDVRIKYIKQKNGGVSAARNRGIEEARGKYLTFIDGDDYILNNMLEKMYHLAESENLNFVVCLHGRERRDCIQNNNLMFTINFLEYLDRILEGDLPRSACGILFNMEKLRRHSTTFYKDMKYGEDMLFSINTVIRSKGKLGVIPFEYYLVEEREGSAIRFMNIDQYNRIELLANRLKEIFYKEEIFENYKEKLDKYFLDDFFLSIHHVINSSETKSKKKKVLNEIKQKKHTEYILSGGRKISKKDRLKLLIIKRVPLNIVLKIYELNNKKKRIKLNE